MKIRKQSDRGVVTGSRCVFLIWDETKAEEPMSKERMERRNRTTAWFSHKLDLSDEQAEKLAADSQKTLNEWDVRLYGVASGKLHLAYVTVHRDGRLTYELDGAIQYTHEEMKLILRLARGAQKRVVFDDSHPLVVANREHSVWLQELDEDGDATGNVYWIPSGWADTYTIANGSISGHDNDDETTGPELYCYAPTQVDWGINGSHVGMIWVQLDVLENMPEITEAEALKSHPNMDRYLKAITADGLHPDEIPEFWTDNYTDPNALVDEVY